MDYDVINKAIDDIIWIVNQYNKKRNYDVSVCERMALALFGYYISFGPEIFTKIDVVLEQLKIYQCSSDLTCLAKKKELRPDYIMPDTNPGTMWDYYYDNTSEKKFIGAVPNIIYFERSLWEDTFVLIHELAHALEGVKASIVYETETEMKLKHGFGEYYIDKNSTGFAKESHGMTELITVTIENKAFRDLSKLDETKIINPLVREFITQIKRYNGYNVMMNSYGIMSGLFKDLIENDAFFELIKKYYFENEREFFIEEFDAMDERLSLKKIAYYADKVYTEDVHEVFYYSGPIRKQLEILNSATGYVPDNRTLIMV